MATPGAVRFECVNPILRVEDMAAALRFYVDVLGFRNAPWGSGDFTCVSREGGAIYLCRGGQGQSGAWIRVGVENVDPLYEDCKARGVTIRMPPAECGWAREMQIVDPDGNVLRIGSEPTERS